MVEFQKAYTKFGDRLQTVTIDDIAKDQFPDALKDVDAVIHSASPLPGRGTSEEILKVSGDLGANGDMLSTWILGSGGRDTKYHTSSTEGWH